MTMKGETSDLSEDFGRMGLRWESRHGVATPGRQRNDGKVMPRRCASR
jgi:hypothetical protein